jgi:serine/threonine protein phosphatase Stp1
MVREVNEDACLDRPEVGLWVVADGMGGHTAGDRASGMIVDSLRALPAPGRLSDYVDEVEKTLLRVNDSLRIMAASQEASTIGSTVAALLAHGGHGACVWAGDSRVYRLRAGVLEKVTQDHALVEELVERGVLTREQAVRHPQANLVTRAVGATDNLCLDVEVFELCGGDRFLLCSDGLDKELEEHEIAEVMMRDNDAPVSSVLVDIALSRGCRDNITVIAVDIAGEGESEDTIPRFGAEDE